MCTVGPAERYRLSAGQNVGTARERLVHGRQGVPEQSSGRGQSRASHQHRGRGRWARARLCPRPRFSVLCSLHSKLVSRCDTLCFCAADACASRALPTSAGGGAARLQACRAERRAAARVQ